MARRICRRAFCIALRKVYVMPTGPDCNMTWDECVAWARQQDSIDDPEAFCGAKEQD